MTSHDDWLAAQARHRANADAFAAAVASMFTEPTLALDEDDDQADDDWSADLMDQIRKDAQR